MRRHGRDKSTPTPREPAVGTRGDIDLPLHASHGLRGRGDSKVAYVAPVTYGAGTHRYRRVNRPHTFSRLNRYNEYQPNNPRNHSGRPPPTEKSHARNVKPAGAIRVAAGVRQCAAGATWAAAARGADADHRGGVRGQRATGAGGHTRRDACRVVARRFAVVFRRAALRLPHLAHVVPHRHRAR